eukprot:m.213259 g.213259  ORF g.213259 m.213259 type:complete len:332 (-) comp22165_c0_seq7:51-1046(-)
MYTNAAMHSPSGSRFSQRDMPGRTSVSVAMSLRRALLSGSIVQLPGVFNGLSAIMARNAGFPAVYVSGGCVSASSGVPDVGLAPITDFLTCIREVSRACQLPVLADADTGFGDAANAARTVHEYHAAGAAALHLEDQEFPKRCGHLVGKKLVSTDEFCTKIEWAVRASERCVRRGGEEMLVVARTDARSVEGLASAVQRAAAYLDAGAHMIFPEGLQSAEEFATFAAELKTQQSQKDARQVLLMANMTEFGQSPLLPVQQLQRMGYHAVIHPVSAFRAAMRAAQSVLEALQTDGDVSRVLPSMLTRQELYALLRYNPRSPWEFPDNTPSPR